MGFNRTVYRLRLVIASASVLLILGVANPATGTLAPGDCVDFEDLTAMTSYAVTDSFSDSGVTVTLGQFQFSDGTWTSGGSARVDTKNLSGGLGNDIQVNNITLDFNFGRPVDDLNFLFGEYGGNINLTINGELRNEADFSSLHGKVVGGTLIEVLGSPWEPGVVRITGTVNAFSVGGQELVIDDVIDAVRDSTASEDCVDFEDLPFPHSYSYGDYFIDSGVIVQFGEFFLYPTGSTIGGTCLVDNTQLSGGTGQDVHSNNINLAFDFGTKYERLSLQYTDYGGNINVRVNGSLANEWVMTDLHMTTLGGASLVVQPATGNTGELIVTGDMSAFAVGGHELWIDHVCISDRFLFKDGFESSDTTAWSATVP